MLLYIFKKNLLHTLPSVSRDWLDWPSTWLSNHCPSVLRHCWLGYWTRKIVPKMAYYVTNGTFNYTVPQGCIILLVAALTNN